MVVCARWQSGYPSVFHHPPLEDICLYLVFLAITRRASVNVPIVVFVWSINFRSSGTNTPTCNCLVVWQLQVLKRMPGCFSEWLRRFLLPSAGQREQNMPSLRLTSIYYCPVFYQRL